jgi:hypothetical protein
MEIMLIVFLLPHFPLLKMGEAGMGLNKNAAGQTCGGEN